MSNISGLAALRKKEAGGSDSDEEEKRKKQELYTGGVGAQGGGSGMAVLGPPAGRCVCVSAFSGCDKTHMSMRSDVAGMSCVVCVLSTFMIFLTSF